MHRWAFVEDNNIVELHYNLPTSWRNISGLQNAENDLEYLLALGWMPIDHEHQSFDPDIYCIQDYINTVGAERVVQTLKLIEVTASSTVPFEIQKQDFMLQLRDIRDAKLKISDWTQLRDSKLSEDSRNNWTVYRQALRDLPEFYNINEEININNVVWPTTIG
jgi:hypothetical protein